MDWPKSEPLSASYASQAADASPTFAPSFGVQDPDYLGGIYPASVMPDDPLTSFMRKHGASDHKDADADVAGSLKEVYAQKLSSNSEKPNSTEPRAKSRSSPSKSARSKKTVLRTACRKSQSSSDESACFAPSSPERRSRHNHNMVEKNYRDCLNNQFERLLEVLQENAQLEEGQGCGTGGTRTGAMSKAQVLDVARRRIHALVKAQTKLQAERDNLLELIQQRQWKL